MPVRCHLSVLLLALPITLSVPGGCLTAFCKADSLIPPEKNEEGWIALFNGKDLTGWEAYGATAEWKVENGILTNVGTGLGWLGTTATFGDFDLEVEWKLSKGGNSSLYYRAGTSTPKVWLNGYDVQMDEDDEKNPTGSLYDRIQAKKIPVPDEKWHTLEVHAEGNHHIIKVDGVTVVDGTDEAYKYGRIGLQMHDDQTTVQFRKVWIRPLGLKPLFNGKDFEGWRTRKHNRQDSPEPVFRVEDNAIRLQGGPGYLETTKEYADFHARFKIRSLPQEDGHSNSGVFLRGPLLPGDNFTVWPEGVEVQILNDSKDFGTGGFYRYSPAKEIYAADGEWFWLDVNVVGNRYVSWVNGMPTAVWVDPENRYQKGILALQANDPKSVTYYGRIEISPLASHVDSTEK